MFCPSCGNEITVELKYCNRCGANLTLTYDNFPAPVVAPVKLLAPTLVLGLTVLIGMGIIIGGATSLAEKNVHPAFITWMVLFGVAMLFGSTALLLRFWSKMLSLNREVYQQPQNVRPPVQIPGPQPQLPPRFEQMPSVTEHTTRTFSRPYHESSDPAAR